MQHIVAIDISNLLVCHKANRVRHRKL